MTIVEFSITPIGKGESVSRWVRRALRIVDGSGLDYAVGPMGTCLEGRWNDIVRVIGRCLKAVARDCPRVSLVLKADHRRGAGRRMAHKVEAATKELRKTR